MATGYPELVEAIVSCGRRRSPRGQDTHELQNCTVVLTDPTKAHPNESGRRYGAAIAAAESACLVGGISDPELLIAAGPNFVRFLDGGALHGAYGPRDRGQLPNVVRRLKDDPDTRQAVLQVWDARYDQAGWVPADLPCTLSFGFAIYDGRLEMTTTMRSNDVWYGVAHDFPMFTCLQLTVADALGLPPGPYTHQAYSLHLYDRDLPAVEDQLGSAPVGKSAGQVPHGGFRTFGNIETGMARARDVAAGVPVSGGSHAENWLLARLSPIAPDRGQLAGAGLS
jgi:thymidylate synthase